ncbi:MAG: type II toxin-antitoxin system RelE/ParE family toxin [Labilibaculum antarcticum]
MNITFANKQIEKLANNISKAQKKLGHERANKFHQRLGELYDAESFAELEFLPGHYHSLKSNRNGQWACNLDHPYRLIFEPNPQPVPCNEHGTPILSEMKIVDIVEITDYH